MLIAHLPSGYLLGAVSQRLAKTRTRTLMAAALFGSVAPDFDMLYFYLIDGRRTHHHVYFTHWPLFWLAIFAVLLLASRRSSRVQVPVITAFSAGALLHMVLDTVAAPLHWLMPFSDRAFELVTCLQPTPTGLSASCCIGHLRSKSQYVLLRLRSF